MLIIFSMIAVVWAIGFAMGAPQRQRWVMTAMILAAVLALHLVLPDGHTLRLATGTSPALWGMVLGFGGIVWIYRLGLARLRAHQRPLPQPARKQHMSEGELERYARHIILRDIGGAGQMRLRQAKVLVVGAGGLGSPALMYLAASGVGTLGIIDDDVVEPSNLQRQIIHPDAAIGLPKPQSAAKALTALNPYVTVRPYGRRLTAEIAEDMFADYDVILDGTDTFATRRLSNATAHRLGKPLIFGALSQWEGQVAVFAKGGPCYACLFPTDPTPTLAPSCAEAGVFAPLPGVIGTMMAAEAVKVITGAGTPLIGRLLIYDGLEAQSRTLRFQHRLGCKTCGGANAP